MSIFNKISGSVNKGIATVGTTSKAMMEKARINAVIANLESQHNQLSGLFGKKIYEMYKSRGEIAADKSITDFIAEIDKRLELISQYKEQLILIEEEVNMVKGGGVNTVFENGRVCACGHANPEEAKFCGKCGNDL
jgi:hypothetical protein